MQMKLKSSLAGCQPDVTLNSDAASFLVTWPLWLQSQQGRIPGVESLPRFESSQEAPGPF